MRALGSAHAKTSMMQCYDTSFVRVVSASLLGTLTAFGLNGAVLAAGPCVEGPSLNPGQGRHWYYRVDRINNRKCWYVAETGLKTHENPLLEPTPVPTSPPNSTLFSWFTSLGAGLPGSASAGIQPSTTQESRVPPAAPRESLKVVHAVAKERSRPGQRPEPKGAATEEGNQQSPSRSSAEHAEQVNSQPLDQAAQDALFLEFLRWKELQKGTK
jgi:hypothetical protein